MLIVEHRIQKIFTVYRVTPDLLYDRRSAFCENHSVKELITLLHANILFYNIINIVIWVQNFHLDMKQAWPAFDPNKTPGHFIIQLAIDIDLHVCAPLRLNSNAGYVCVSIKRNDC